MLCLLSFFSLSDTSTLTRFSSGFQFSSLFGAASRWILDHSPEAEARAREEALQNALAVGENLRKELSEKADEARRREARMQELEEENRATSEERDRKVAELTQLEDEVGSLRRRLEESERARAVDKVCSGFLNLLSFSTCCLW